MVRNPKAERERRVSYFGQVKSNTVIHEFTKKRIAFYFMVQN
jgi:hypothetical protein